jgi:hypothetical protein
VRRVARLVVAAVLATALLVPAAPAEGASLSVRITSLPSACRGCDAHATVATKAGARCAITVVYKSGPSHASGLGARTAGPNGTVAWQWRVGSNTTRGNWPVTVTCAKGAARGSATRYLAVR